MKKTASDIVFDSKEFKNKRSNIRNYNNIDEYENGKQTKQVQLRLKKQQKRKLQEYKLIPKQKMLQQMKRQLNQKLKIDQEIKLKLFQQENERVQKQKKIAFQLEQINKQNQIWMNQLNQFYKHIQSKKKTLRTSNQIKEQQKLIQQYQKHLQLQQRIKLTKNYRQKVEKNNWAEINQQKRKISHILKQNQNKLLSIVRSKSHQVSRRIPDKKIVQQKPIIKQQEKKPRKSKNIDQLKQLGRRYLQFAKKAQKSKSQKRLLKLQNKNIDYPHQIKDLIKLKVDDLSKKPQIKFEQTILSKRKRALKNTIGSLNSMLLTNPQNLAYQKSSNVKKNKIKI